MAISHNTRKFGVSDAKLYVVTADTSGGTTYGAAIDVPGIKSVTFDESAEVKSLRGDNQELDADVVIGARTGTVNYAKHSLDIRAALMGLSVTDAGTGSTETATVTTTGSARPVYVKLEAKTEGVDIVGGDTHLVIYKMIATSLPTAGFAEEDYSLPSFGFRAVPRISDGKVFDDKLNETAAALSS